MIFGRYEWREWPVPMSMLGVERYDGTFFTIVPKGYWKRKGK